MTATAAGTKNVQLLDEDGLPTNVHLGVDVGVVITAWRPRRMATPRYRVRSTDGVEGWVDATNLRRIPPPPPPPTPVVAAPVQTPKPAAVKGAKSIPAKAAKPTPVKAVVKPVAKPAVPPKRPHPSSKPVAKPVRAKAPVKKKPAARHAKKRAR